MKINTKTMVFIMIGVLLAGGIYIFNVGSKPEGKLNGIDPASYDISATCTEVDDNMLMCNEGNDMYLVLNDTDVGVEKSHIVINEDGDEKINVTYRESSMEDLKNAIEKNGTVSLNLWMTSNGKVEYILMLEESIDNYSETLSGLGDFDPESYNSENTVVSMDNWYVTLAPANYSAENKDKLKEFVKTYEFAENAEYYRVSIKEVMEGKKIKKRNFRYMHINAAVAYEDVEKNNLVRVWFDNEGRIAKMMTIDITKEEE